MFELDLAARELRKQGVRLQLRPKPLQLLAILLEHPGEIVTRDELRRLWVTTLPSTMSGLNTAANRLRIKLGDSADSPRYIETRARSGDRFIGPVERIDWEPPSSPAMESKPTQSPRWYVPENTFSCAQCHLQVGQGTDFVFHNTLRTSGASGAVPNNVILNYKFVAGNAAVNSSVDDRHDYRAVG